MLIGNVGTEPEIRYADQGVCVARFRFATTERGYTLQNGTQVPDRTDWHTILLWRKLAEIAQRYVHKGDKLYIEGRIRYTVFDDKKGQRQYATEIWGENMELLTPKPQPQTQAENTQPQGQSGLSQSQTSKENADALPF